MNFDSLIHRSKLINILKINIMKTATITRSNTVKAGQINDFLYKHLNLQNNLPSSEIIRYNNDERRNQRELVQRLISEINRINPDRIFVMTDSDFLVSDLENSGIIIERVNVCQDGIMEHLLETK